MATTKELREAIVRIIADVAQRDPSEITDTTRLAEDLRIKSANRIEMAVLVTDTVGVELPTFDALKAKTVGDVISAVEASSDGTG